MELSLSMWLLVILSAVMIGMSKVGVSGIGTLVIPIMAFVFGGMPSSGLVLPMLIMADVFGVIYYHRSTHWKTVLGVLPWAFIGILVGWLVGKNISSEQFKQLIGLLVILSLVVMGWTELRKKKAALTVTHKAMVSIPFGVMGGFSTMIGNAAGPIMSVYLLSKNLPKKEYIGTAAWFFFIINLSKMPLQIWGWNNITIKTLSFNLMLLPAIALGAYLGIKIVKLFPESMYRWFVLGATFFSALALLF
ncbi:MAG: sulfite exporter TauE/SafE family protein [Paludibacter sp.]|nr:sulfite exporter TauE/SafE family protein [Paludibacter sp.]